MKFIRIIFKKKGFFLIGIILCLCCNERPDNAAWGGGGGSVYSDNHTETQKRKKFRVLECSRLMEWAQDEGKSRHMPPPINFLRIKIGEENLPHINNKNYK
jgi:hypothetical protein